MATVIELAGVRAQKARVAPPPADPVQEAVDGLRALAAEMREMRERGGKPIGRANNVVEMPIDPIIARRLAYAAFANSLQQRMAEIEAELEFLREK